MSNIEFHSLTGERSERVNNAKEMRRRVVMMLIIIRILILDNYVVKATINVNPNSSSSMLASHIGDEVEVDIVSVPQLSILSQDVFGMRQIIWKQFWNQWTKKERDCFKYARTVCRKYYDPNTILYHTCRLFKYLECLDGKFLFLLPSP